MLHPQCNLLLLVEAKIYEHKNLQYQYRFFIYVCGLNKVNSRHVPFRNSWSSRFHRQTERFGLKTDISVYICNKF